MRLKQNKHFKRKSAVIAMTLLILTLAGWGCGQAQNPATGEDANGENVIITETGEVLEKEAPETETATAEPTQSPETVTLQVPLEEPAQEQVVTAHDEVSTPDPNKLQIVFLGDSIFDTYRDGTGVPYLVSTACESSVYNLAIAGTSASLEVGEPQSYEEWTSKSLVGISLMLGGRVSTDPINGTRSKEVMQSLDVSNTDYFVVEYGINDFFRVVPLSNAENPLDLTTYAGALRVAVSNLHELAPNATVILCGPHYAQFYHKGRFVGDGNVLNNGYGTLFDYKGISQYVAKEQSALFMDAYMDLGIDGNNADQYLEDGVHLTAEGRKLYADYLANMILKYEETKNN